MLLRAFPILLAAGLSLSAQQTAEPPAVSAGASSETVARPEPAAPDAGASKQEDQLVAERPAPDKPAEKTFAVEPNTRIPLSMISSISTKDTVPGDRVYLETVFPILAGGRIVIPPGSYVEGTITKVQRPGKVKGRGEFYLRFDTLILPNGVTREFHARVSGLDGRASETLDRTEGSIKSEGNKAGDAQTVGETTVAGASIGALAGSAAGAAGMGAGIGAAAGAAAGLATVLLGRGPDAVLAKGTSLEMVLDHPLEFRESELNFSNSIGRPNVGEGGGPLPSQKKSGYSRRWPL